MDSNLQSDTRAMNQLVALGILLGCALVLAISVGIVMLAGA